MPIVLSYALRVLNALPNLIESGIDIYDFVIETNANIKEMQETGSDPSASQWEALNQAIEDLRNQRPTV